MQVWNVFLGNLCHHFTENYPDVKSAEIACVRQYCFLQIFGLMAVAPSAKWKHYRKSGGERLFTTATKVVCFNDYFRNVLIPYMEREDRSDFGRRQPRSRSVSPDARSAEVSLSLVHLMSLLALQGEI